MGFPAGFLRNTFPVVTTCIVLSHLRAPGSVHHSNNLTPALSLLEIEPCPPEVSAKAVAEFEQT